MDLLLQLLVFAVIFGIVVGIHEYGHYAAGRLFGAAVDSFSFGFGKPLWEARDKRGTRWRINAFPLGGFVKFVAPATEKREGEGDEGESAAAPRPKGIAYPELKPFQRIVIALAGPFANFFLAILLFAVVIGVHGTAVERIAVGGVVAGSAAEEAGFEPGDIIQTIDGKVVNDRQDFFVPIAFGSGTPLRFGVERAGEKIDLILTPRRVKKENELGQMVEIGEAGIMYQPVVVDVIRYNPVTAVGAGVSETIGTVQQSVHMLARLFTGREPLSNVHGPVGIADITRRAIDLNMQVEQAPLGARLWGAFWTMIQLTALISIGIGLMNLLPLPVLDGGHVVFNAWEMLSGRAVSEKVQEVSLTFGLVLLFGVAVIVTWHDIVGTGILGGLGKQ